MSDQSGASPDPPKKRIRCRWLFWVFGALLLLAVIFHLTASSIVTAVVNRKLPDILNTAASLGELRLNLLSGRAELTELIIRQPGSKDGTPFLSMKGLRTQIPLFKAISANPVTIESLEVDRLECSIIKESDGTLNFTHFISTDPTPGAAPVHATESSQLPPIWLKNLHASELGLRYIDRQNHQEIVITNFNVSLRNLLVTPNTDPALLPKFSLDAIDMDRLNLLLTLETTPVAAVASKKKQRFDPIGEQKTTPAEPLPQLWVKAVRATQFELHLLNQASGLDLLLEDFNLEIDNLLMGKIEGEPLFADLRLNSKLRGVQSSSSVQVDGRIAPLLSARAPAMQIAASIVGFELDSIAPILETGAVKTLGKGLDLNIMLEIHPGNLPSEQTLGGEWQLLTSSQVEFNNHIEGTLSAPELGLGDLTQQLLVGGTFRMTSNVAGNVVSGSREAVGTLGETGVEAVAGVGKTTKGFLGGLWGIVKGTATLDKKEITEGLESATTGTISAAGHAVIDTSETATEGVVDTAQSTGGVGKEDIWLDQIIARAKTAREKGLEWLSQRSFPTE